MKPTLPPIHIIPEPPDINSPTRLTTLKNQRFLTAKFFAKLSENMHCEIFKNLNSKELLQIRATKLGGFQLTSNPNIRYKIGNNFKYIFPEFSFENTGRDVRLLQHLFEQTGEYKLPLGLMILRDEGITQISGVLKYITMVRHIDLSWNNCGDDGIIAISNNLKYVTHLEKINLEHNDIGNIGIIALAENFEYIPKLEFLNLAHNYIQDKGIQELVYKLKYIPNLKIFKLNNNIFSTQGAALLAYDIRYLVLLEEINLSNNCIENNEAQILIQSTNLLPNLLKLELTGCLLIYPLAEELQISSLQNNPTMQILLDEKNIAYDPDEPWSI